MNLENHLNLRNYFSSLSEFSGLLEKNIEFWKLILEVSCFLDSYELDENNNYVDPTASVDSHAIIKNSYIGKNAKVYDFVNIRDSLIGDHTTVGHCSEVVRSIILSEVSIPRFNYIGSSIIGNRVRFGGVCSLASRRFDDSNVIIKENKECVETDQFKFGSLVGDDCILGYAVHCNPGTMIGKSCIIMPHCEIRGYIPQESIVSVQQKLLVSKKRALNGLGLRNVSK